MLNSVGNSSLVSGFFWDDVWHPDCTINDQVPNTCIDMGFICSVNQPHGNSSCQDPRLVQLTTDYQKNMQALREAALDAGKFAWQMLWTGGEPDGIGDGSLSPLVTVQNCATELRSMCRMDSPAQTRAMALLDRVGIAERASHRPAALSGGEQQRVAFCRALANEPSLLLADEPTGNLDPETSDRVFDTLMRLVRDTGLAAVIATHNLDLAARMDRQVRLNNGVLEDL
jgi:ABC-type transport system involved in cytochrome bd biosynthesis fused ATPase/permease subunit